MQFVDDRDNSGALCRVKGYRFSFLTLLGYLGIFFSVLCFVIIYQEREHSSPQTLLIGGIVCGIVAALSLTLSIWDIVAERRMKNKDCVLLFKDGMTVYSTKPQKGYIHFNYEDIEDYGFIHIIRGKESSETRPLFRTKQQSAGTYLYGDLKNYGYMRITAKDGGYYNVPVGDIETVERFLKERTSLKEFRYQRIAGIDDDIIIPLQ